MLRFLKIWIDIEIFQNIFPSTKRIMWFSSVWYEKFYLLIKKLKPVFHSSVESLLVRMYYSFIYSWIWVSNILLKSIFLWFHFHCAVYAQAFFSSFRTLTWAFIVLHMCETAYRIFTYNSKELSAILFSLKKRKALTAMFVLWPWL